MLNGKKILAIVPARSGSKGVPNKNIKIIGGKHLIGYTGEFIKKIKLIDKSIVSTDSYKYLKIAKKYGLDGFFLRSKKLSKSRVSDIDVILDSLVRSENFYNIKFDIIVYLQPTSPIRSKIDLQKAIKILVSKKLDSVWSVNKVDVKYHPLKQLKYDKYLDFFNKNGSKIIARQQLSKTYIRNGIFYVISRDCIIRKKSILGTKSMPFVNNHVSFNIDTKKDISDFKNYVAIRN